MTLMSEGQRQRAVADAHDLEARLARERAARHDMGDTGEQVTRVVLEPLTAEGWRLMHRRAWPGTRRGDIDHLLVGPGGVIVLDSKNWSGRVRLSNGRLLQGQADVTSELDDVGRQVQAVEDVLVGQSLAPLQVTGGMIFVGQQLPLAYAGRVHVLNEGALLPWLRALGTRLDESAIAALHDLLEEAVPPYDESDRPIVPVVRPRPRARQADPAPTLFDVAELDLAELERATSLGIEQWMVYLHPSQLDVVRRRYNGPCRVRGPAGCGKTVVALHRAAYLALQEPGELLFMTYVRTLPRVLATLYQRLSPHTAHRAKFAGAHQLALQVLRHAGVTTRLDPKAADTAFARAWAQVGRAHLETPALPMSYWSEEVQSVIKGRGLQDFDDYASLARTGRRTRLTSDQRKQVWDLYVRYQELLDEKQIHDYGDVVALAVAVAERGHAPTFRFVVVDEAQDLDLLSVRLAAALVSEPRDGLTLVGDGQQAVYAGGYTLKEAGLVVTGRSTVLDVNYRNTRQVLDAAHQLVSVDTFDDLEDVEESGSRKASAVRDGAAVMEVVAADVGSAEVALVQRLQHDAALGLAYADAAVLCRTLREAEAAHALLRRHGIPVLGLADYDGTRSDAVKVGTAKRAKGLEFDRVYLPRIDSYLTQDGDAEPERIERERRELFVAMTRARNGLWRCRVTG
jgi:hypothetical protein